MFGVRRIISSHVRQSSALTRNHGFATSMTYNSCGQPADVLKVTTVGPTGALGATEVALKFLAAPINPADINMVQGVYGVKAEFPAVGGNEGVAVVEHVGSGVKSFKIGDWVLPAKSPFGTWTQSAIAESSDLVKVPSDIPVEYAATLSVNPSTAYRMLRDFQKLQPGDVIIQNGANSMVGLSVIQLAREMGVKTINVVRSDRPELDKTLALLTSLGGDINIPDTFVNSYEFNEIVKELPPLKLALNCVGGESATNMVRVLAPNGTMVNYGSMSKKPLTLPEEVVADKQLKIEGFWMTKWYETHSMEERSAMVNELASLVRRKQLTFFYDVHDFDDFYYALKKSAEPFNFRKVVLNMDYPDRLLEHDRKTDEDYKMFETSVV